MEELPPIRGKIELDIGHWKQGIDSVKADATQAAASVERVEKSVDAATGATRRHVAVAIDRAADQVLAGEPGEPLEIVEGTPGAKQSYIDLRDAAESLQGAIARFLHVINSRRADQAGDL